jgi:hypothetical protein
LIRSAATGANRGADLAWKAFPGAAEARFADDVRPHRRGDAKRQQEDQMPAATNDAHKDGEYFVDYEQKIPEDGKVEPGENYLVRFHPVAFEG